MSSIFLSHSRQDKDFVQRLTKDLRRNGHVVWIDESEIRVGDSLIEKIRDGIDKVDFVAAILSKTSVQSEWVKRELDVAMNREIESKRVIVLPIMIEKVELPGFLKGKFYADFRNTDLYNDSLEKLLTKLGPTEKPKDMSIEEINELKAELKEAKKLSEYHQNEIKRREKLILQKKSPKLLKAIEEENADYPEYATINNAYAFEVWDIPITLSYIMHAIRKAKIKGSHQLEIALTHDEKWGDYKAMIEAYTDFIGVSSTD